MSIFLSRPRPWISPTEGVATARFLCCGLFMAQVNRRNRSEWDIWPRATPERSRHGKFDLQICRRFFAMAGYEDVNDAERLSQDPTLRLIGSEKIWERGAALTSRLQSFETEVLAQEENLASGFGSDQPGTDRSGGSHRFLAAGGAGHGQHRDPGLRTTGAQRLQRPLRVHLLSPAVAVQSRG